MKKSILALSVTLLLVATGTFASFGWAIMRSHAPLPTTVLSAEREKTPPNMVYVPAGDFLMGTNDPDADDDVRPMRRVWVPSFYMDRTEVTNKEYQRLVPSHTFPKGEENLPATTITFAAAETYAKRAGKRIPTEAEWEKAARGTDGRRYPWGDTWQQSLVAAHADGKNRVRFHVPNSCFLGSRKSGSQPVGSTPKNVSPYGCVDMAGNAWEWVQGYYNNDPQQRILRGGAINSGERSSRTYTRSIEGVDSTCGDTGFRCAKSVAP